MSAYLSATAMGKRSSSATGAAAKKAKTKIADTNAPAVGNWVQTKFLEKDWQNATKIGILKNDPTEVQIDEPEIIPRPPAGFWVLFLAFSSKDFLFLRILSSLGSSLPMGFSFTI
jgi:hypothetical protein